MQRKNTASLIVWIVTCLIIFFSQFFKAVYNEPNPNFLCWDVYGYYSYLPYHFIYDDPAQTNMATHDYIFNKYDPSSTWYQAFRLPNGNWMTSYSIGLSYLYAPFFFIAHGIAHISGYPPDGFSYPYQICIETGMLLYIFLGLYYLRKLLLRYFNDAVTAITMVLIVFGTNIFNEAYNDVLEPHAVLFFSYCILMYYLDRWYEKLSFKYSLLLGFLSGLMLVIRGSEIFLTVLLLLWGVNSWNTLRLRPKFILSNIRYYVVLGVAAIITMLPQFIYFYRVSGDWFFNNYQLTEGFNLADPNLIDFFFSFKKGVFIYTPVILTCVIALFLPSFRKWKSSMAIYIFLVLNTYLVSCWLVWWGAGSYSSRYFAQSQSMFVIPLGFLVADIFKRGKVYKTGISVVLVLLLALNLFQTWQFARGIIHSELMTKEYYKAIFLKTRTPANAKSLLEENWDAKESRDFPGEDKFRRKILYYVDFDSLNTEFIHDEWLCDTLSYQGKHSFMLNDRIRYSPTLRIPVKELGKQMGGWIGIKVHYYASFDLKEAPISIIACESITGTGRDNTKYRGLDLETLPFEKNKWNAATFYYHTPRPFRKDDVLTVYVTNRGNRQVYIDQFEVYFYEKK